MLTEQLLAQRWFCSTPRLQRWRMDEKGPSYLKIGCKVLYRLEDVRLYELSCRVKTAASSRQIQTIQKIWHGDSLAIEVRKQQIDFIGYFSWGLFFIPAREGNIAVFEKNES